MLRKFGPLCFGMVFGIAALAGTAMPASAQRMGSFYQTIGVADAREYFDQFNIRHIIVRNLSAMLLDCRILDANGSWVGLRLAPGGEVYKTVHPNNAFQWNCVVA